MPRKIKPADINDMERIRRARSHVADAAYELAMARCPQSHKRARALLKSIEGAIRHAEHRINRTKQEGQS